MEKLKRCDIQAKLGRGGHLYTKEIESSTGRYMLADEVISQEECLRLTEKEFNTRFDLLFSEFFLKDDLKKDEKGEYIKKEIRLAFEMCRLMAYCGEWIKKDGE